MTFPRHIAFKHAARPRFSEKNPDFIPWTRDARTRAITVVFLRAFVSEPPQYIIILHICSSPREAWGLLVEWYAPQTAGAKSDHSRRHPILKIASGSNPLDEMGRMEDLATEMRTAGLALDNHMLYTVFIDALPAGFEAEAGNLASRDSIDCGIIKAVRE